MLTNEPGDDRTQKLHNNYKVKAQQQQPNDYPQQAANHNKDLTSAILKMNDAFMDE